MHNAERREHCPASFEREHLPYANMEQGRLYPMLYSVGEMFEGFDTIQRLAESPQHVIPGPRPTGNDTLPGRENPAWKASWRG